MNRVLNYFDQIENSQHREISINLHELILSLVIPCEYSIKWKVPFYMHCGNLCYINPRKNRIDLGFYQGAKLSDPFSILQGDGILVKHIHLFTLEDVYQETLAEMLVIASNFNKNSKHVN